ncbi:MAG: xylulokinase [Pirellulales bacterium]|nr:xylulokinase [Pirellulales bacterium]
MAYYLGLDVGTSGTKAVVMAADGRVLATATADHEVASPRPGWSEQNPDRWHAASVEAARAAVERAGIDGRQVAGIGLSGQMHGLVVTDAAGRPLRPAIIWNDQRTADEARHVEQTVGGRDQLISLVGNAAMTSFTLTKLLWVRRHEPGIFDQTRHMLLPKDYVRLCLTGEYVGDASDMSGTLMLDQRTRDWSAPILSTFEIDREILPPVVESHEIAGRLTRAAAERLGLAEGTPVAAGGGDQPVGAVGNGVVREGLTSATLGTSGVVYVHSKSYRVDPESRVNTFCSCVAGQWCLFGCVLSAGGSLQWFRNVLGAKEVEQARTAGCDPYELLMDRAEKAPPGCEGLFFLPYLTGERTPHTDPLARGCWIGLTARTGRDALVRSVVEGATFAMADVVDLLRSRGVEPCEIRLSGGGTRGALWRQLQADVYGAACATINCEEGPAYGAALLAAVGTGRFADLDEACGAAIRVTQTIHPRPDAQRFYRELHKQYDRLYAALKDEFAAIARLPREIGP